MNSSNLIGRLVSNPDNLKAVGQKGSLCLRITIAVDNPHKKDDTSFIPLCIWGDLAGYISENFTKGDMIGVTGCIVTSNYTDDKGQKKYYWEVEVDRVTFCNNKKSNTNTQQNPIGQSNANQVQVQNSQGAVNSSGPIGQGKQSPINQNVNPISSNQNQQNIGITSNQSIQINNSKGQPNPFNNSKGQPNPFNNNGNGQPNPLNNNGNGQGIPFSN